MPRRRGSRWRQNDRAVLVFLLGVAFGVMFGGLFASQFAPQVRYILPVSMDKIALALFQGQALPAAAVSQLIATAAWSPMFTIVALWRFERIEF